MADPYRYFRIEARELIDEITAGLAGLGRGEPPGDLVGGLLRHAHTLKGAARVVSQAGIADHTHALEGLLTPFRGSVGPVPADEVEAMLGLVDEMGDLLRALDTPPAVAGEVPGQVTGRVTGRAAIEVRAEEPSGMRARTPAQLPVAAEAQLPVVAGAQLPVVAEAQLPVVAQGQLPVVAAGQPVGRTPDVAPEPIPVQVSVQGTVPAPRSAGPEARPQQTPQTPPQQTPQALPEAVRVARASLAEIDAVIDGVGQSRTQLSLLRDCAARVARLRERADVSGELEDAIDAVQRALGSCTDRMDRELREVHDVAERLRLVPVTSIMPDLEGAARDVAAAQGKKVHVEVGGGQLRLDAPVLTAVQGALRQIVRNAVAHGIEAPDDRVAAGKPAGGRVRLDVRQQGGQVVFSCTDDGRGIDLEAVRRELARNRPASGPLPDDEVLELLSLGGVSTAPTVSEVSGRGIGLDVVRDAATRLGGRVAIRTTAGAGTTIDLTTPLSLSAQEVLLMDDGAVLALPLAAVQETARVGADEIVTGLGGEILRRRGQELPFLPLALALGDETCTARSRPAWSVLILAGPSGPVAVGVHRLIGTATIAIRALPRLAPVSPLVSGTWLDVDARPRLVLDAAVLSAAAAGRRTVTVAAPPPPLAPILIVDDSLTTRMLEQSVLESAGYRVELAASAEEGLTMAARKPYALVLVDVEMPGMDGFAFIEQTRARPELRHLPCILVTSRASAQDRRRGLEAGARAHIDKREFHQGTLLRRITEVLGG